MVETPLRVRHLYSQVPDMTCNRWKSFLYSLTFAVIYAASALCFSGPVDDAVIGFASVVRPGIRQTSTIAASNTGRIHQKASCMARRALCASASWWETRPVCALRL